MTGYTVHLDYNLEHELTHDALLEDTLIPKLLKDRSPVYSISARSFGVTASIEAIDPIRAAAVLAADVEGELSPYFATLIGLDVETWEATDAAADEPNFPELVGAAEVGELLGVTRQRVHQLHTQRDDFPPPIVQLRMGPLWLKSAVEVWAETWERRPGRPPKVTSHPLPSGGTHYDITIDDDALGGDYLR